MIKGTGIDIVSVKRIKKAIEREGFKERYFTRNEIDYCEKYKNCEEQYAGKFAAKEAFIKATGNKKLKLKEIEVLNTEDGKPFINVKLIERGNIYVSISHEREFAVAVVIIEE